MMVLVDRTGGKKKKYSMDAWPGYARERMELMEFLAKEKGANPIVLSGDIHANWVNDLRVDDRDHDTKVVATEFVGTSISSGGKGGEVDAEKFRAVVKDNPFVHFHHDERGYLRCVVTPDVWQSDFRRVGDVTRKGGGMETRGSFVVQAGKAGAKKA